MRTLHTLRRRPIVATSAAALSVSLSALAVLSPQAGIPTGWSTVSAVDGGTSALGTSIATTATTAFVGATFEVATGGSTPVGAVYAYTKGAGGWTSRAIFPTSPIDNGNFGTAVAASGGLVAVGAVGASPGGYVFSASDGGYTMAHSWSDPASDPNQNFGSSVAVYSGQGGSYVAVAAPNASADAGGIVYLSRQLDGGAWSNPLQELSNGPNGSFGIAVAFAGNGDLLVGDPGTGTGQVLVYRSQADGGWAPRGALTATLDGGTVHQFGNSLATSAEHLIVTAPGTVPAAGAAYNGAAIVFALSDAGSFTEEAVLVGASNQTLGNFAPFISDTYAAVGATIKTDAALTGVVDVWVPNGGGGWVQAPGLPGDSYYGQAVAAVGATLFIGDTSAAGAATVADVRSALYILDPALGDAGGDAGAATDGGLDSSVAPGNDAAAVDSAVPPVDGSSPHIDSGVTADASSPADASGDSSPTGVGLGSGPASSGCGCATVGERSERANVGIFGLILGLLAAKSRRRRPV